MTQKNSVGMVKGGQFIDITSRNIPVSIKAASNKTDARASLIFDHYYAITTDSDGGFTNDETWVCDLRRVVAVQNDMADAVWFPWALEAKYWIQLKNNTVLMFDSTDGYIYEVSFDNKYDEDKDGNVVEIVSTLRTKNFKGNNLFSLKQPRMLFLSGKFENDIKVVPYYFRGKAASEMLYEPLENVFIAGISIMGTPLTSFVNMLEAPVPCETVGNSFSFQFRSENRDTFFQLSDIQFTFKEFERQI